MGADLSVQKVSISRDKVVIVTGGNSGIGYETAKHLAMMGANVTIASRSEEKATQAITRMNEEFAQLRAAGISEYIDDELLNVNFMCLDLASLKSTMDFIEAFKSTGKALHTLICNAGLAMPVLVYTDDDNETMFQVNYLSHFLIIAHLLPIMRQSGDDCRIVLTSSLVHRFPSYSLDTIQARNGEFGMISYYGKSKLYQIMQMYAQCRRLKDSNVTINSVHPGYVDTNISPSNGSKMARAFSRTLHIVRTPIQGASVLINTAVDTKLRGVCGVYYSDSKPAYTSTSARNEADQEELWAYTLDCLKDLLPEDILKSLQGDE